MNMLTVCKHEPVQTLYEKAKAVLRHYGGSGQPGSTLAELKQAIEELEGCARASAKLSHVRALASTKYGRGDDVEIDHANLTHHNGNPDDPGYWVGAWLWIPEEDV